MELLSLKIALVVSVIGLAGFITGYTIMTRGRAWTNPIGQTIQLESLFLLGTLTPLLGAAFWHFDALSSEILTWVLIGFLFLTGVSMFWRLAVFVQIYRKDGGNDNVRDNGGWPQP